MWEGVVRQARHGSVRSVMARPVMVWFGRLGSVRSATAWRRLSWNGMAGKESIRKETA